MRSIENWVRSLGQEELSWQYDIQALIALHQELHQQFGDKPSEAIIPGEQRLSELLRGWGIEHRYEDKLSKDAGTLIENMAAPTIDEMRLYLERDITLLSGAVALVQDADGGDIYLKIEDGVFGDSTAKSILKMFNRWLPASLQVKAMPKADKGEFATVAPTHALSLQPRYARREVTLWANLTKKLRESASDSSKIFKRDSDPRVELRVIEVRKSDPGSDWHFVLGEVLVPNEPDRTRTAESDADIYDEVETEKACHWFAANSQEFEYMHAACGGHPLDADEIRMVENYIQRGTLVVKRGDEDYEVKQGTWLMGAEVRGSVWTAVEKGDLNIWSISAKAMAAFEEVQTE